MNASYKAGHRPSQCNVYRRT